MVVGAMCVECDIGVCHYFMPIDLFCADFTWQFLAACHAVSVYCIRVRPYSRRRRQATRCRLDSLWTLCSGWRRPCDDDGGGSTRWRWRLWWWRGGRVAHRQRWLWWEWCRLVSRIARTSTSTRQILSTPKRVATDYMTIRTKPMKHM